MRGVESTGHRRAAGQGDADPVAGSVVSETGGERAGRGVDGARQQAQTSVIGQLSGDAIRIDDGLRKATWKMLRDLSGLAQGIGYGGEGAGGVIGELG